MNIGKTLYVSTRRQWRSWLASHHSTEPEIWLIYYKKNSGKPRIDYNHAVEEALCYGWIDSIVKAIDEEKYTQRFSPRKKSSQWSPMNIERLRRLKAAGKVRKAGLEAAKNVLGTRRGRGADPSGWANSWETRKEIIPSDIRSALKEDPIVWKNFSRFPASYKRIRVGWINGSKNRPEAFRRRLNYFIRMTRQNKRFGMVQ